MSLRQCVAYKPNGERCKHPAAEGSDYCYSHRRGQHSPPRPAPSVTERLQEHFFNCADCGRLLPPGHALTFTLSPGGPKEGLVLCEPCYRLRRQIEDRILEIVTAAPNHTLHRDDIYADLAQFGVDQDLVEAARLRMHADGRLVRPPAGGST